MTTKALVLFSGGQDSTTCLAWALKKYEYVETIGFDYRQRHSVELECRKTVLSSLKARFPAWSSRLGTDLVLDLGVLSEISETALTSEQEIYLQGNGLPNTFVPGRNLLFFTLAAAVAYRRGIDTLVAGMCETDYSGYPDCRNKTIEAMQFALCLGMDRNIRVETPLMWLDKAATWELARQLGGQTLVNIVKAETHTCYLGDHVTSHEWGFGCGVCPACELRGRGYVEFAREASLA